MKWIVELEGGEAFPANAAAACRIAATGRPGGYLGEVFRGLEAALNAAETSPRACAFTRDQLINALGELPVSSAVAALEREGATLGELADAIIAAIEAGDGTAAAPDAGG